MEQLNALLKELSLSLQERHWQLVTAESCTGGLIAGFITELPGSSSWFERGFVSYSNLAKQEMLAVSAALIEKSGAVSEEVALAMANGALKYSAADIALSVTGVAGPGGGSKEKPVGTVCFAWAARDGSVYSVRKQFNGSREEIRLASCQEALQGTLVFMKSILSI